MTDSASITAPTECVVLLHGLGRTSASMFWLANDLRRAGYLVVNQNYPSRRKTIPELSHKVHAAISSCEQLASSAFPISNNSHPVRVPVRIPVPITVRVSFVTHSMGAILLRSYFANPAFQRTEKVLLGRAVLLGPPNQGSEIVDQMRSRWYFKLANGPAGVALGTAPDGYLASLPGLPMNFGVIAGVAAQQNWLLPKLPMPHDGKVSVASTHLAGESAHLQVPVKHTWLPSNLKVRKHVISYLQNGIFSHETVTGAPD